MTYPEWARAQRLEHDGAQMLLELIADLCDQNGYLSVEQTDLAELLEVHRRTVIRRFEVLDELGLVYRHNLRGEKGKPLGQAIFLQTVSDTKVTRKCHVSDTKVTPPTYIDFNNTHTRARARVEDLQLALHVEREGYLLYLDTLAEAGIYPNFGQMQAHQRALARIAASGVDPNLAVELATQKLWDGFDAPKLIRMLGEKGSAPRLADRDKPKTATNSAAPGNEHRPQHDAAELAKRRAKAEDEANRASEEAFADAVEEGEDDWTAQTRSASARSTYLARFDPATWQLKPDETEPARAQETQANDTRRKLFEQAAALARDGL